MEALPRSHARVQLRVAADVQPAAKVHVQVTATATRRLSPSPSVGAGLELGS